MKRAYYCREETIRSICEDKTSWQFRLLKSFPAIRMLSNNVISLPSIFEEYYAKTERLSCEAIQDNRERLLQRKISTFESIDDIDYSQVGNCLFEDIDLPKSDLDRYGVEVIHEHDYSPLMRHWFVNTRAGKSVFSWEAFFKNGSIQKSNSVIIMDRYLFIGVQRDKKGNKYKFVKKYKNSSENINEILKTIIPGSFSGDYHILFVFDDEQLVVKTPDNSKSLEKSLCSICQIITKGLNKSCSLNLEFLGIHNGKRIEKKDSPDVKNKKFYLQRLYSLTHDRRIISNYFMVNATHGWDALQYLNNHTPKAKETQSFYYDALLSGIDNPDQADISNSIPIDYVQSFVDDFVKALTFAKEGSYYCYRYSVNTGLEQITIDKLQNRVLLLSKNPVQIKPWNPTSRLFGRDNQKPSKYRY